MCEKRRERKKVKEREYKERSTERDRCVVTCMIDSVKSAREKEKEIEIQR
jgi:hypothetical protein